MLFDTTKLGSIKLQNRVVMAPMTRVRASETGLPSPALRSTTPSAHPQG